MKHQPARFFCFGAHFLGSVGTVGQMTVRAWQLPLGLLYPSSERCARKLRRGRKGPAWGAHRACHCAHVGVRASPFLPCHCHCVHVGIMRAPPLLPDYVRGSRNRELPASRSGSPGLQRLKKAGPASVAAESAAARRPRTHRGRGRRARPHPTVPGHRHQIRRDLPVQVVHRKSEPVGETSQRKGQAV